MSDADLKSGYQLIAEVLLNPDDRDPERIARLHQELVRSLPCTGELIGIFLETSGADSRDEYVQTLELSPPCPLYLGAHQFDEPSTCNGVGSSGRNAYMLELIGLYQHFELDLAGVELPDFLPVIVDFLWISLESDARDRVPLRRWCLEHHVQPGLDPLSESLAKYKSPYQLVVSALREIVEEDLHRMGDTPAWKPPQEQDQKGIALPVLMDHDEAIPGAEPVLSQLELQP